MEFDINNNIVKLCIKGMDMEGKGQSTDAAILFNRAWKEATTDFEKFTASHYVARHQKSASDKLHCDKIALLHALNIDDENINAALPSLYLTQIAAKTTIFSFFWNVFQYLNYRIPADKGFCLSDGLVVHMGVFVN